MKRKLKLKLIDILKKLGCLIRFSLVRNYQIGELQLKIPLNHTLPYFKSRHRLYDEFIGYIASEIDSDKCIVDVGANVGDTAAFIANRSICDLVLFEPSKKYFEYLSNNIKGWNLSQEIHLHQVGLSNTIERQGGLSHYGGTAVYNDNIKDGIKFIKGDDVSMPGPVGLIKVDTDGYDSDVILSFQETLRTDEPLIFWENQIISLELSNEYTQMYLTIEKMGYSEIYAFDNFGNFISKISSYEQLNELNAYLYRMMSNGLENTFFYLDILAGKECHKNTVNRSIDNFLSQQFVNNM